MSLLDHGKAGLSVKQSLSFIKILPAITPSFEVAFYPSSQILARISKDPALLPLARLRVHLFQDVKPVLRKHIMDKVLKGESKRMNI